MPDFKREGGDLDECVRSGLENGADNADRGGKLVEFKILIKFARFERLPEGVVLSGDTAHHLDDAIEFRIRELETVDKSLGVLAGFEQFFGGLDIRGVGRLDRLTVVVDGVGDRLQGRLPVAVVDVGEVECGGLGGVNLCFYRLVSRSGVVGGVTIAGRVGVTHCRHR
ncbi:MAG: hypothetical protein J07HN4v3_02558 [Halonotius sp. J07HN4]|nr:MAG: hypothetical protein J07HN4v3_02558 [Halonotius sp. J07HN4]